MNGNRIGIVLLLGLAAACGGTSPVSPPPAPPPPPPPPAPASLRIVGGAGATDTIGVTLANPVVVEVKKEGGALATSELVRFRVQDLVLPATYYPLCVSTTSPSPGCGNTEDTVRTDGNGQARAYVRFQYIAARAVLRVEVAALSLADSASFLIAPGAAARIRASPKDTAVLVGGTNTLVTAAYDRGGNIRSDPVDYAVVSGPVTVSNSGLVTGTAIGRGLVRARAAGLDTVVATSVVPTATIAVQAWPVGVAQQTALVSMRTDGAQIQVLVTGPGLPDSPEAVNWPLWSPTDGTLAYSQGGQLKVLQPGGQPTVIGVGLNDVATSSPLGFGSPGASVYFTRLLGGGFSGWRIATDGSGLVQVTEPGASAPPFSGVETSPSPDPAGANVVYDSNVNDPIALILRTRSLGSGLVKSLGLTGRSPRWSPDGTRIAYLDNHFRLAVAASDGVNPTLLTEFVIAPGFGWSPDSRWIVAEAMTAEQHLVLVDTQSGLNLPMYLKPPGALYATKPSWKAIP